MVSLHQASCRLNKNPATKHPKPPKSPKSLRPRRKCRPLQACVDAVHAVAIVYHDLCHSIADEPSLRTQPVRPIADEPSLCGLGS
jgi:hypothetical protein